MKVNVNGIHSACRSEHLAGAPQTATWGYESQRTLRSDSKANREGLELLRRLHGGHSGTAEW